jgi:adenosylcobinamide-phosphate synthase
MTLLSIILSLLIEQVRPLAVGRVYGWLDAWAELLESRFNAGEQSHGIAAWVVGAAVPALLVFGIYLLLLWGNWVVALAFNIGMLYLTTGFRQFSHYFTDIQLALRMGEIERSRQLLAEWRRTNADRLSSGEIARLAVEQALLSSHRHVFGPLFWFALLGPAGVVLYRLAGHLDHVWGDGKGADYGEFGEFARKVYDVIDWIPVRLTAAAFAVVGDFEDAVYCWRSQADRWPEQSPGILLAAGAGALGVRLGMPIHAEDDLGTRPELGVGEEADPDAMQSTIGLVWRTLVMALLLLALLGVAGWVGK